MSSMRNRNLVQHPDRDKDILPIGKPKLDDLDYKISYQDHLLAQGIRVHGIRSTRGSRTVC